MTNEYREFESIPLLQSEEGRAVVRQICNEFKIPESVLFDLIRAELEQIGKQRKKNLKALFGDAFARMEQTNVDS